MFARSNGPLPAIQMGFPNVCKVPGLVPVPVPFPSISLCSTTIPTVYNVFFQGFPAANLMCQEALSTMDAAGVLGGVASGTFAGPTRHVTSSTNVFYRSAPATKMGDMTSQNNGNCVGNQVSTSQTKVIISR